MIVSNLSRTYQSVLAQGLAIWHYLEKCQLCWHPEQDIIDRTGLPCLQDPSILIILSNPGRESSMCPFKSREIVRPTIFVFISEGFFFGIIVGFPAYFPI
jgi:hypothetical protein